MAWIILILVYIFPFRYAFLSGLYPGRSSMLNFLAVVAGSAIFFILMYNADSKKI